MDPAQRLLRAWRPLAAALGLLALLLVALPPPAGAQTRDTGEKEEPRRVALVLGNAAYRYATRLPNATADARAIAATLKTIGFEVIEGTDLTREGLLRALLAFARRAHQAEIALVFFAGHAVQVENENWIVPVDARLRGRSELEREAVSFTTLLEPTLGASTRIIMLDACRDDPFREGFLAKGGLYDASAGLARPGVTEVGTFIAFATSPGTVAYDAASSTEKNSPFTSAFVQHIGTRGLEINELFNRVRGDVFNATRARQTPWQTSSLLQELYLSGRPDSRAQEQEVELTLWRSIERSAVAADFELFLKRFPNSTFASLAAKRRDELRERNWGTLATVKDCPECPELVALPAGSFIMGAAQGDPEKNESEGPPHRVNVPPVLMGRYPVTFDEWEACVRDKGCPDTPDDAGWGRGRRPVIDISWEDAQRYVGWLSRRTGKRYRLPSEAEWEYAARAGADSARFWGEDSGRACRFANVYDTSARRSMRATWLPHACDDGFVNTAPVGSFQPNAFGLYDVVGNVWQWTADCWEDDYSGASGEARARDTRGCAFRTMRGGSFMSDPPRARVTSRMRNDPQDKDINIGLRIARDP